MKIYVAMHKIIQLKFKSNLYEPLLVGSYNKESDNICRDDLGENISDKNENYCELTGLYWMWKNSKEDILGLCHYRRFLSKNQFLNNDKYYITSADIDKCFKEENYNIILPKKQYYKNKIITERSIAPNIADINVLREVVNDKYPEFIKEFDSFINGKSAYLCNVMITTKELLNEYCSWLFDILFETEKRLDKNTYVNDAYRKRMFGFLSERLLNIWVLHNSSKLKVKEYHLINTEQKTSSKIINSIKQKIKKIIS